MMSDTKHQIHWPLTLLFGIFFAVFFFWILVGKATMGTSSLNLLEPLKAESRTNLATNSWTNRMTLLILSAPSPMDPDITPLEDVYGAYLHHLPMIRASPRVIAFDGVAEALAEDRKANYLDKIKRTQYRFRPPYWNGTKICLTPYYVHYTGNLLYAFENCVSTPLVLVVQHDLKFTKSVPNLLELTDIMLDESNHMNYVYFRDDDKAHFYYHPECQHHVHRDGTNKPCFFSMMQDVHISPTLSMTKVVGFIDMVHLVRRDWYLDKILFPALYWSLKYNKYPEWPGVTRANEEVGVLLEKQNLDEPWPESYKQWGTYMYGSFNDSKSKGHYVHLRFRCATDDSGKKTCDKKSWG